MPVPKRSLLPVLPLLILAACNATGPTTSQAVVAGAGTVDGEQPAAATASSDEAAGDPVDLEQLERDLARARIRLEIARLEAGSARAKAVGEVDFAQVELDLAREDLERFSAEIRQRRVAEAQLDLQTARDRAQEAQDELAQIEIMYDGQDLDDLTAEFVVSRGRRQAQRAQARIALQEAAFANLRDHELRQEEARLTLAVRRKELALDQARIGAQVTDQRQELAIDEAEQAVADLEEKLAEARRDAGDDSTPSSATSEEARG